MRRASEVRRSLAGEIGFTLAEVLVASLCIGIMMVSFTQVFKTLVAIWLKGTNLVDSTQGIGVALARLYPDIRSAVPPYEHAEEVNFVGVDNPTTTPTNTADDWLRFHSAKRSSDEGSATNSGSEILRIDYWLKDVDDLGKDVRIQRGQSNSKLIDTVVANANNNPPGSNQPFVYNITQFKLEYYNGSTWFNSWDARSTTNGRNLPELVRITISTHYDGDTTSRAVVVRPQARDTFISGKTW